jgi:alpha-D-xyloside xylohydrolase
MPYTYTLAADTYQRDGSIMRGLVMDFPADKTARDINDEYLFGKAFLVAPVTAVQGPLAAVYLPAGATWYDFESGKAFKGGQTIKADAPLSRMPLFVKAGSIVPTTVVQQYVGEQPDAPLTVVVYTGADGTFELYEDDGLSNGYARGAWSRIPMSYDNASGRLTIGARSGRSRGCLRTARSRCGSSGAGPSRSTSRRWIRPWSTLASRWW